MRPTTYLIITVLITSLLCSASLMAKAMQTPLVSVQLHSVKNAITQDFNGTLTALAHMGFTGVEFAGRYGPYKDDPTALKQFLTSIGLQASGAHISVKQLRGEQGAKHFAFFKALGAKLIFIPHDERIDDPKQMPALFAELTMLSELANQYGLTLGYHNHAKEFSRFQGETFWDHLAKNTPKNFALQLDVGWANFAGVDPLTYVNRYPNRTLAAHIKIRTTADKKLMAKIPNNVPVVIGQDNYDWARLVNALHTKGGTQWLVIEQEETHVGKTRLETVQQSLKGLQKVLNDTFR
ncbi:sugar phosphate isomerase/epimerase family protein [Thalassotalea sp. PLHSN55]|uniref:sugar phosphate isomerase/epimerase family protein n=1 Tax=Thalassotalea sp. PLHSN55 TaxID=3435888 RepID=UPI003F847923